MTDKYVDMEYNYECVCKELRNMHYADLVSFSNGLAASLKMDDGAETIAMICDALIDTAASHLEAHLPEDAPTQETSK